VPVYTYYFTKDNRGMGCHHAGELPYFYGCLDAHPQNYDETDRVLSAQMLQYYVNFIKTGDPNGSGLPEWKTDAASGGKVLELGAQVRMIEDPHLGLHELLDQYQDGLE
ncbi:MAG: carboxylesterase family protein, partial [Oscillospiraceae bacterium]|nr:carboxylesterase family protein [Oscillospiraceae bacterium]